MKIQENITDQLIITLIRNLGIDCPNKAQSGHPGMVLGAAPIGYCLFKNHLNINPNDEKWLNRDRFVLSAGHGCVLLYSLLHLFGFKVSLEDLQKFRQIDSITPGHPELNVTPGVDFSTGPLGQGISGAVGMAMAEIYAGKYYNREGLTIIDYHTYVLCSDGDLQEGVSYEAMSLAGRLKLNKLIVLYDSNQIQLDGPVSDDFNEQIKERCHSCHWDYLFVKDGNDFEAINQALNTAKTNQKPTLIEIRTIIGFGTGVANSYLAHGSPVGSILGQQFKVDQHLPLVDFYLPNEVYGFCQQQIAVRLKKYHQWQITYEKYQHQFPKLAKQLTSLQHQQFKFDRQEFLSHLNLKPQPMEIRQSVGLIFKILQEQYPIFFGGSADLAVSTKIMGHLGTFDPAADLIGNNIRFGVREFVMASICNGISTSKLAVSFCSTFLVFSDYMRNAIRMACIMQLPVLFFFSHDCINVGQDGPTHQPIEHLASLRLIPNLKVFRPADTNEVIGIFEWFLQQPLHQPVVIIASRNAYPQLSTTSIGNVQKGTYFVKFQPQAMINIIASGSDLHTAFNLAERFLKTFKLQINITSNVCQNLFYQQPQSYQKQILANPYQIILESAMSVEQIMFPNAATSKTLFLGINQFGHSGAPTDVVKKMFFDEESLYQKIFDFLLEHKILSSSASITK